MSRPDLRLIPGLLAHERYGEEFDPSPGLPYLLDPLERINWPDPGPFDEAAINGFDDAVAWVRSRPRRPRGDVFDLHLDLGRRPACIRHSFFCPEFGPDSLSHALEPLRDCRHNYVLLLDVRGGGGRTAPTERELRVWPVVSAAYEAAGARLLDIVVTTPKKASSLGATWVERGGAPTLGPWRWS